MVIHIPTLVLIGYIQISFLILQKVYYCCRIILNFKSISKKYFPFRIQLQFIQRFDQRTFLARYSMWPCWTLVVLTQVCGQLHITCYVLSPRHLTSRLRGNSWKLQVNFNPSRIHFFHQRALYAANICSLEVVSFDDINCFYCFAIWLEVGMRKLTPACICRPVFGLH